MSTPQSPTGTRTHSRGRTLSTGVIGTFVEYYDFAVYGLVAPVIALRFFPSDDPQAALLSTFGVLAIGFLGRPLGGLVFSHYGDTIGRRNVLSVAILVMTLSTVAIAVIPGYESIGIAAPMLLLLVRFVQSFSVGGEFSGASSFVVEHAPPERRGLHGASINISSVAPFVAAIAVVLPFSALLTEEQFAAWGWRIPFLLAAPLGLVGVYMRRHVPETPDYQAVKSRGKIEKLPALTAVRTQFRRILLLFVAASVSGLSFYMLSSYMVTYLSEELGYSRTTALLVNAAAVGAFCVVGLALARYSDTVGRRPVMLGSQIALLVLGVPSFLLMSSGSVPAALVGQVLFAVSLAGLSVMTTVVSVELFPASIRYSCNAIGYQGAYMLFAGTAPFVSTMLISLTGSTLAPAVYASGAALVALLILGPALPETRPAAA